MGFGITQEIIDAMALTAGTLASIALQGMAAGQPEGKTLKMGQLALGVDEVVDTLVKTGCAPQPNYQKEEA